MQYGENMLYIKRALGAICFVVFTLPAISVQAADKQAKVVANELAVIANQFALKPEMAIDFSNVSGEYCFNGGLGKGGHMTHYAIDPTNTNEDIIDFVNASDLVESGINLKDLPMFPGELGAMDPNQWYFLPAGEFEPHHGKKFSFPLLIRASNI